MSANKKCISCPLNHCCHACICRECSRDCGYCHDTLKVKGRTEQCLCIDIDNGTGLKYRKDDRTMTKAAIERRLEAAEKQFIGLQDEIANLKAKLDDVQENEIPDFPVFERGDAYYYSNGDFDYVKSEHSGYCGKTGEYELYNAFHSEEYAKLYSDKCREIAMLLHCKWYVDRDISVDWTVDWRESQKYCVCFDHKTGLYVIDTRHYYESSIVIFNAKESAQKAADWMNAHAKRGADND